MDIAACVALFAAGFGLGMALGGVVADAMRHRAEEEDDARP